MENSNPKLENMWKAEASEFESQSGSIEVVVTRLLRWGRIAPSGLARVEYISDTSQMAAVQRLRDGFQQADIPFVEIALPMRKSASEQVRFLRTRLAQIESGVVSITGFAYAFSEDTPLLESLRVLNYNRENLADFPLCQIWWMPRDFTQIFRQSIPDLNSWFIIKLRLDEIIAPPGLISRPLEDTSPLPMSHEEGITASNFYAARFRTALQRHAEEETLWQLWVDAVKPLIDVGRTNAAIHLQDALLHEALENKIEMRRYLTKEQPQPGLLGDIGAIFYQEEQHTEAEPFLLKALAIRRASLPVGHPDIAVNLNNLAQLYESQGRYSEAEPLFLEALTIWRAALPEGHPHISASLNNLAALYRIQGRYSEAEPLFQAALAIRQASLPVDHPDIAVSLNNLAQLYESQGRYSEVEPLLQEALAIWRTALPEGHPDIAISLNNLAEFYRTQGRYPEAEPLLQEALAIGRASLPAGHPAIAISLNNLAGWYSNQGRYSEVEPLLQEALAIWRTALPDRHPNIAISLNNLAGWYSNQGRFDKAEMLYEEALAIRRASLPDGHPDIAISLNNLAHLYYSQGDYAQAKSLYEEAMNMFMISLGNEHPSTKTVLANYAHLLERIRERTEDGTTTVSL